MSMKLPDSLARVSLADMCLGETVYVAPWAMYVDTLGECYLNGGYSFVYQPFGTQQLEVSKTLDGYVVNVSKCPNHKWSVGMSGYVGEFVPLSVVGVEGVL